MSYLLRHHPEDGGLQPDAHGFVALDALAEALKVPAETVLQVVERDPKGRFEVADGMIRAVYGHSYEVEDPGEPCEPPDVLYHGTPRRSVDAILREGLRPMGRQMVHLSGTVAEAREVGRRRDSRPVVLVIDAKGAAEAGIRFRRAGEVYLCAHVPAVFVRRAACDGG
jgi:putative RNA 2'-phosphotransferase